MKRKRAVWLVIAVLMGVGVIAMLIAMEDRTMSIEAAQCRNGNKEACEMVKGSYRAKEVDKAAARRILGQKP